MRFIPVAAALFALTSVSFAWTQDRNGVWTANNNWHWIGGDKFHEGCTVMGTQKTHTGPCAYFSDDKGTIFRGHCAIVLGHDHTEVHCR